MNHKESQFRSLAKAVSWRFFGTLVTFIAAWWITGELPIAVALGGIEFVGKIALFYLHERLWNHLPVGQAATRHSPQKKGCIVWLTGLPCSGKTTLAKEVLQRLRIAGHMAEHLDGDEMRGVVGNTGFSAAERKLHLRYVTYIAKKLEENGVTVICSFVSPWRESRDFARSLSSNFVEVYLSTAVEQCAERDVKGHYAKARQGQMQNFTGVDDAYEPPDQAEVELDTAVLDRETCVRRILAAIMPPASSG